MNILFVSPEVAPYAKTGGLADVAGALPQAIRELDHEVWVMMPLYRRVIDPNGSGLSIGELEEFIPPFQVPIGRRQETVQVLRYQKDSGAPILFVKHDEYFDREELYGTPGGDYPDNAERFICFARAILETCRRGSFLPDLIHCNDWQTSLVPVYLKTLYRNDAVLGKIASLLTIHNLGYQGLFPPEAMELAGLPPDLFTLHYLEYYGQMNFLKGGILFSDIVTTVSERYSQEIQTAEYGQGLEGVLGECREKLHGILNGIDYRVWNPDTDPYLPANYGPNDLSGKKACKKALQERVGLPPKEDVPLLGTISRLALQKGFDLIADIMEELLSLDCQWILLGRGDQYYEDLFQEIGRRYPQKVSVNLAYDESLAHQIEGGCDLFLMPSRYEPCGLNQLYSLKYGTIPLVRATGGLDDTVLDLDPTQKKGTGFKFREYSSGTLLECVKRALLAYHHPPLWQKLIRQAMKEDFSWQASARRYAQLYRKACNETLSANQPSSQIPGEESAGNTEE